MAKLTPKAPSKVVIIPRPPVPSQPENQNPKSTGEDTPEPIESEDMQKEEKK